MTDICDAYNIGVISYRASLEIQRRLTTAVQHGGTSRLLLLEHPPVFTLGRGGVRSNLLASVDRLKALGAEVISADRGGDVTFHGPGQLVVYPIIRLPGVRQAVSYVRTLEQVVIDTLADFGVSVQRVPGRPGVWLDDRRKVCAVGVRISRGVTSHGFALNVTTDLSWFRHIVPCGLPDAEPASLRQVLGSRTPEMSEVGARVVDNFGRLFSYDMRLRNADELQDRAVSPDDERGALTPAAEEVAA